MVEQVTAADDKRVVVYASGARGGWGVLLTHGPSRRELSGVEGGAERDRMSLLAVVSAVECLTRPTAVLVLTDNEYVRRGVAARTQGAVSDPRDTDLWARLGAAVKQHRVQWVVVDAALATRAAALAASSPHREAPPTAARRDTPAAPPRDDAPAAPRRGEPAAPPRNNTPEPPPRRETPPAPQRDEAPAAPQRDEVPAAPRREAPHPAARRDTSPAPQRDEAPAAPQRDERPPRDDAPAAAPRREAPAARAADEKEAPARRGLPAELAAAMRPASTLDRPSGERASLPFRAGDPIPTPKAPEPTKAPESTKAPEPTEPPAVAQPNEEPEEHDESTDEFLEELQLWLEDEPAPTDPIDEWLREAPLRVIGIAADSITFEAPDTRTLGPIPLPEGLADQVDLGWRLTLTAARTGDTWHLRPTE
ncbi:RNase H family protein [Cryptosporangium sp. NPDC048952]|uniref:RNase H family protein n=1 Tax=Cryptosporangium sp. NPDC048952 TaxID=3363961 RepID=UPI0037203CB6